mmetsp:Transcript_13486/g.20353  ORF Transcript_13486/g.20353 Transcript_13486/m.20353 type:complete len:245 (+) Transcript_13486:167-901(+)
MFNMKFYFFAKVQGDVLRFTNTRNRVSNFFILTIGRIFIRNIAIIGDIRRCRSDGTMQETFIVQTHPSTTCRYQIIRIETVTIRHIKHKHFVVQFDFDLRFLVNDMKRSQLNIFIAIIVLHIITFALRMIVAFAIQALLVDRVNECDIRQLRLVIINVSKEDAHTIAFSEVHASLPIGFTVKIVFDAFLFFLFFVRVPSITNNATTLFVTHWRLHHTFEGHHRLKRWNHTARLCLCLFELRWGL